MSELAALITAGTGAASVLGAGIVWLWRRVENGFKEVKLELKACQEREAASSKRETALQLQMRETASKHLTVIELLWQEVQRRTRGPNDVLERCKKHLDDLKETAQP